VSDWDDFNAPSPEPKHARTKKARVTTANPRSQDASHPYVDLIAEGFEPFRVDDITSSTFGALERIEVHEISHNPTRGRYSGYGPRVLRSGLLAVRSEYVNIPPEDVPPALIERLTP
jgi:uncharacterized membrane protein